MASPAAIADDSVQPVPWVFAVAMRSAASRVNAEVEDEAERRRVELVHEVLRSDDRLAVERALRADLQPEDDI